jgi:hypothetical protein
MESEEARSAMDFRDIEALQNILKILGDFEPIEQERLLRWVAEKLELKRDQTGSKRPTASLPLVADTPEAPVADGLQSFATVADLMASINVRTHAERALAVAVFLQYRNAKPALTGFEINNELKHLGHMLSNITDTLSALQNTNPKLLIQIRKSGKTRQARKQYKVTDAGYRRILQILQQGPTDEES